VQCQWKPTSKTIGSAEGWCEPGGFLFETESAARRLLGGEAGHVRSCAWSAAPFRKLAGKHFSVAGGIGWSRHGSRARCAIDEELGRCLGSGHCGEHLRHVGHSAMARGPLSSKRSARLARTGGRNGIFSRFALFGSGRGGGATADTGLPTFDCI